MHYCIQCRELMDSPCGIRRHETRAPQPGDQVLLFRGDSIQAGILTSMLKEENLPFLKEGRMGAGLTTWAGEMMESYSLYVPFELYEKARELAVVLMSSPVETPEDPDTTNTLN